MKVIIYEHSYDALLNEVCVTKLEAEQVREGLYVVDKTMKICKRFFGKITTEYYDGRPIMFHTEENPQLFLTLLIEEENKRIEELEKLKESAVKRKNLLYKLLYPNLSQAVDFDMLLEAGLTHSILAMVEYSIDAYEHKDVIDYDYDAGGLTTTDENVCLDAVSWWQGGVDTEYIIDYLTDFLDEEGSDSNAC